MNNPTSDNRILAAILFTDIAAFTALMQRDEGEALRIQERFFSILRQLHETRGGRIVKSLGDGALSIFPSAVDAVQCAVDLQREFQEAPRIPVRMGIHLGDVIDQGDDIIGDAVNLAARIESFSVPGAVLISGELYQQIRNQPQFQFKSLGAFQLKNVETPVHLYALSGPGLIVPDPAALQGKGERQPPAVDNFPKVLTSFLGRDKEIAEVTALLVDHRLITLTGPGGTGKTRLSIQIAREAAGQFPAGIFWVPLAAVREAQNLPYAIAKELGLKEDALLSIEAVLIHFFRDKRALLVLDNFEQVVEAAPVVEQLLRSCENLHILVSSRIVLQVPGEEEYQVPPLNVPRLNGSNTLERLQEAPSVALFAERARSHRRTFQLTPENIEAVARICIKLDGLPLAIELAAARTKIFTPDALLKRLDKRLDVLKGDGRFPERHQTLRQTIAWSYELLDTDEQELFRRASVFVGGSTLEALEEICGQDGRDVMDGVTALVDKSLLQTEATEDDLRFFMLETIREFAFDELEASGKAVDVKKAHILYFLQLAERAVPHFYGPEGRLWGIRLKQEQANLKAAIDYAIELKEISLAYRIGYALRVSWTNSGLLKEGVIELQKLAAIPFPESLRADRLRTLQGMSLMYLMMLDLEKAVAIVEESLAYWREHGTKEQVGQALNDLGWAHYWTGKLAKGEAYSLEAKAIFEQLANPSRLLASLNNLSSIYLNRGVPEKALFYLQQTADLAYQLSDIRRGTFCLLNRSDAHYQKGDYALATSQIMEALKICKKNLYKTMEGYGLINLGFIHYATGDYKACRDGSWELERSGRETNTPYAVMCAFIHRALAAFGDGSLDDAIHWSGQAEVIGNKIKKMRWTVQNTALQGNIAVRQQNTRVAKGCAGKLLMGEIEEARYTGFISGLELAARVAALEDAYDTAARLFFNARALRETLGTPVFQSEKPLYDAFVTELENHLSERSLLSAQQQRLDDHQLLELANQIINF